MINPQECKSRILRNDPEAVDSLYDLLLWIKQSKGSRHDAMVEQFMRSVYADTQDSAKHQHAYDLHQLGESTERKSPESSMSVN